jgi:predicted Zn-ribbon and HTH transcriptional regulator
MGIRPGRLCSFGGCFAVVTAVGATRCPKHIGAAAAADKARKADDEFRHLSDRKLWRVHVRPAVLRRCGYICERRINGTRCTNPADHVHHQIAAVLYIEQHGGDEDFYFDESNLRGVCSSCHTWLTAQEREGRPVVDCFGPPPESTWSPVI